MKVKYYDKPFRIPNIAIKDIHVIDNWLIPHMQKWFNYHLQSLEWSLTNQVTNHDGTYRHRFWGIPMYSLERQYFSFIRSLLSNSLSLALQNQFCFKWTELEYVGMNGQTMGLDGTKHIDAHSDNNISFLYFNNEYWDSEWGGNLNFYSKDQSECVASVEYIPNRLVFFDGRIPHQADAPVNCKYEFRQSLVIRGDAKVLDSTLPV